MVFCAVGGTGIDDLGEMKSVIWKIIAVCMIAVIAFDLWLSGPFIFGPIKERLQRRAFDPILWKSNVADRRDPVRSRMVDDLLNKNKLAGLSKQQVADLLGKPEMNDENYLKSQVWRYWLGGETQAFIKIKYKWLLLDFNDQGNVNRCTVFSTE
jgi:hypothetical protein